MTHFLLALSFALAGSVPPRPVLVRRSTAPAANPFERLIQITRSNDRLVAELGQARRRLGQAVAYASDPESRLDLAQPWWPMPGKSSPGPRPAPANRSEAVAILASGAGRR